MNSLSNASPSETSALSEAAKISPVRKKSPRRRSRELALQGLYEWRVSASTAGYIDAHMRELEEYPKCDKAHFDTLLHGSIRECKDLEKLFIKHLDRSTAELSPVEHAALLIGAYELKHCFDIPYKVVINESVELTKSFGGTDGHKYVNGVLDKVAIELRSAEVQAIKARTSL